MAVLADFDIFLYPLKRIKNTPLLSHKGISHSYFFAFLVSGLTGVIFSFITNEPFLLAWIVGFLFYSLHLSLDALCASKIPLFYPFYKKKVRFFIDRAINFNLALVSGGMILFYFIIFFVWPALYFSKLIFFLVAFYILYFSYRIIIKIWVQFKLPKNSHFIPGINPFSYLIYTTDFHEQQTNFKLIKKLSFNSHSNLLIETTLEKNSLQAKLFEEALIIAQNYAFFSKWEYKIPFIKESESIMEITILLAESYYRGRGYGFQIKYDKRTHKIIDKSEGFNLHAKNPLT